jgi:hypothetical protein
MLVSLLFLFIFLEKLLSKGRLNLATSTNIKDMQLDTKNISEELLAKHLILYIYIYIYILSAIQISYSNSFSFISILPAL